MKRLSIIIPVYNLENYIEETLDICLEQDIPEEEYEIICIDDGSLDKSFEKIEKYAQNHKNIIAVKKENGGVSSARNKGLDVATGKYIWFVDGDDLPAKNTLSSALDFLEENDIDIFGFKIKSTYNREAPDCKWETPRTCCDEEKKYNFMTEVGGVGGGVWSQWYKRSVIEENKIRFCENIKYSEDVLFSFVVLINSKKCAKSDSVLYNYYQREGSAMHSKNKLKHAESMYLLAKEYDKMALLYQNTIWHKIITSKRSFAVKAMLFSLAREGNVKLAKEKIKELKHEGLYPYPFLFSSLKNNQTKKQAIINYVSFLLPAKWYFMLMVRFFALRKKHK